MCLYLQIIIHKNYRPLRALEVGMGEGKSTPPLLEILVLVINLPKTTEKLPCKGKPYWLSDYRNPLVQTQILLLI